MSVLRFSFIFFTFFLSSQSQGQNLSILFSKSYSAEKSGNLEEAISVLQAPFLANTYEVNLRLGWLYYSDKKYNESVAYYQKAKQLKPNSTEALWGMINPLSVQEKWLRIEQTYKEILKLDPGNSKANYFLGSIYFYRKDYLSAKKYLQNVVNLYPFDHDSNLLLGWSYYYLGKLNEAKTSFYHVLNNKPDDASAKEGLGLIK